MTGGKGKHSKKKKRSELEENVVRVANPLQQDLLLLDDDDADSLAAKAGSDTNGSGAAEADTAAPAAAAAADSPAGTAKGFLHHIEEVAVKDVQQIKGFVRKNESIISEDLLIVGKVGSHLANEGAKAAADATKAAAAATIATTFAFGDALMGNEFAKVERMFNRIDADGSGFLDRDEVKLLLHELGKDVTDEFIQNIMHTMDPDGDEEVTLEEFKDWWVSEGFNSSVLGDSVGLIKDLGGAPILVFYHLFDDNTAWFETLGEPGIPLAHLSRMIKWSLNVLQLVWSSAAVLETVSTMSADPDKNPESWQFWSTLWWWINMVCAFMFSSEWTCRFLGAVPSGNIKSFFTDKMTYLDLVTNVSGLSIVFGVKVDLSTYEFTYEDSGTPVDCRWLRIIRMSRVLKTIRNERINELAPVVWQILDKSLVALLIPAFVLIIMVQVCASLFFYLEAPASVTCELPHGERISNWMPTMELNPGCLTEYTCACAGTIIYMHNNWITGEVIEMTAKQADNIFVAWWWALVTVTTVGYGDIAPVTASGRVLGAITGFVGLLIVAMPIAIVGKSFNDAYAQMMIRLAKANKIAAEKKALREKLRNQKRERAKLRSQGLLPPKRTGSNKSQQVPRSNSSDAKLARNANKYSGDRQDVLLHLALVSEKLQKLDADLSMGHESPTVGPRSEISELCDAIASLRGQVVKVWPAESQTATAMPTIVALDRE